LSVLLDCLHATFEFSPDFDRLPQIVMAYPGAFYAPIVGFVCKARGARAITI
jgi:hypothetical protein